MKKYKVVKFIFSRTSFIDDTHSFKKYFVKLKTEHMLVEKNSLILYLSYVNFCQCTYLMLFLQLTLYLSCY